MEEILASIRRIIADDPEPSAQAASAKAVAPPHDGDDSDDILDLADLPEAGRRPSIDLDIEVSDIAFSDYVPPNEPIHRPEPEPEPEAVALDARASEAAPSITAAPTPPPVAERPAAAAAAPAEPVAFAPPLDRPSAASPAEPLAEAPAATIVSNQTTESVSHAFNLLSHTIMTQNARTLEDLVREMLRPMLKIWLDDNLPPLVERLVRAEIERVARGNR